MALFRYLTLYFVLYRVGYVTSASVKRNNDSRQNGLDRDNTFDEDLALPDYWWESTKKGDGSTPRVQNIKEEIMNDLNHIDSKEKLRIFDDLKKQKKTKFVGLSEVDSISPLNIVELRAVRKSINTPNSMLPTIRNKRTLNFLLFAVARAMGYALIPRNPDVELVAVQSSPCRGIAPRPPPCAPPPPPPPTTPPPPTIPPPQIDANTIRYPYRPSQQIPLLQFAPLPAGVTVPYPPLLQWPCGQTTPAPPPNPCAPSTKAPSPCVPPTPQPPCAKPPPPPPGPPCGLPPPPPPPPPSCSPPHPPPPPPPHHPPPPCSPPPKNPLPPPCAPPPPPCAPPPKNPCSPPPSSRHPPPPPPPVPAPPKDPHHPQPPMKPPVTLEYDHPVKIQIFNNGKKFLPASGSVYSGNPSHSASTPEKLEEYEKLDEDRQERKGGEHAVSSPNIFREDEENSNEENYDDGHDEINMELRSRSKDEEFEKGDDDDDDDDDEDKGYTRSERFYKRRVLSQPYRPWQSHPKYSNFIDGNSKKQDYYSSGRLSETPKKAVLKRVIKIRKPVTRHVDENGNEYTFARSTVHEIQKRDLQDFDFIRKYKETQGDTTEDEHYRDENPPGRTTTSIKKIEVKKFFVNKSEDDPVEYHEKSERNHDEKPQKVEVAADPRQPQHEEHEEEGGGEDEKISYRQYEPPEQEGRPEVEKALQREIARDEEEEEEEPAPRTVDYDRPPPIAGKGVQYVTKTITKYVGGSGGKETVRVVPIYKIVHVPPPIPPRPPPVKKIIHHHHHRIPVYPKIVVRTGPSVKRRPAIIAGLSHPGNVLLVTIRERNG